MGATKKAPPRPYPSLRHRILANVERAPAPGWTELRSKCWLWKGSKNARGYGQMAVRKPAYCIETGRKLPSKAGYVLVHRLVLAEFFGIPLQLVEAAMHRCSIKRCCNPEHIDPGTRAENQEFYYTVERPMRLAIEAGAMREPRVHRMPPSEARAAMRAETLPGVAEAMAQQWGAAP